MSSTIDFRRFLGALVILGWLAGLAISIPALLLPLAGNAQAAIVLTGGRLQARSLPPGVGILEWRSERVRLSGVDARAARALYAAGALLVYPVRNGGCLSLRAAS